MKALAAAVALVVMLVSRALAAETPLLVTPTWLAERLGQPGVRVIDVSDPEDYAHGHIPGAVHFDIADARMKTPEGVFRMPTAHEGRRLLARLGITPETAVVLYDDEGGLDAAWLFLVLDVLGQPRVSMLDGGSQRWRAAGGVWTNERPRARWSKVPLPHVDSERVADAAWVRARLGREDVVLVDARSPDESMAAICARAAAATSQGRRASSGGGTCGSTARSGHRSSCGACTPSRGSRQTRRW